MTQIQKHHWNTYPPKSVSLESFFELIKFLKNFKEELKPVKRSIKVQIFGEEIFAEKMNDDIETIFSPYVLEKIHEIKIFLLFNKDEKNSCETLIHISSGLTFVSISDIGTEWGAAVRADLNRYLKDNKFVARFIWARLHGLLKILMFPFLILGSTFFILWHFEKNPSYLVSMLGFLLAGFLLLSKDIYLYFVPAKPYQVIATKKKTKQISIQLLITVLSLLTAILAIAKEIISFIKQ